MRDFYIRHFIGKWPADTAINVVVRPTFTWSAAVTIALVAPAPVEDASEYVASIASLGSTSIQPQLEGQIVRVLVKSGDRVEVGTPLFEIDPRRQQAAVSREEADLASRQAAVALAQQEQQRMAELFASGTVPKQSVDRAEAALKTAQSDLEALNARINEERVRLRYYSVAAPVGGVVGDVPARVGMQVGPQTLLTTVDTLDRLELQVPVPVEHASDLRVGLPVRLVGSDGRELAATTLSFVSPRVDERGQTVLAKAVLRAIATPLRVEQTVRAVIVWRTLEAIRIPVVATVRVSGQHFAYVAEEKDGGLVARQRTIKVGRIVDNDYLVEDGLKVGDRVITSGTQRLADGGPIQVKP